MKTMKKILFTAVLAFALIACKNESAPEVKTVEVKTSKTEKVLNPDATYAKAEFGIDGMTCAIGCAKTIEKKLAKMDGVKSATVDFDRELAMVEYDEAMVTPTVLTEMVTSVADVYKVKDMKSVDEFSAKKSCDKECCKGKSAEEKANCEKECCKGEKAKGEKMACKPDCQKACCAKKA
ncbi:MAG: heavy-metal-associated domain-containing protein [Flavobacteriaceae bacterium]|nr:cation transporter [Bacteroidia bacterium]NNL61568.1 heavy-metal-associated domain-containing protein [Flavobacteriaceae bacterium]